MAERLVLAGLGTGEAIRGKKVTEYKWALPREYVLDRDNYSCVRCGIDIDEVREQGFNSVNPRFGVCRFRLHMHHVYGRDHEEYDKDLVTLCPKCHGVVEDNPTENQKIAKLLIKKYGNKRLPEFEFAPIPI